MPRRSPDLAVVAWVGIGGLLALVALAAGVPGELASRSVSEEAEGAQREPDRYTRALEAYRAGQPERALTLLDAAIGRRPDQPGLWGLRGWVLLRLGRDGEAGESFERASALDPSSAEPHTGLGHLDLRNGDPEEALIQFDAALERLPGASDALQGKAQALWLLGRASEARHLLAPLLAAQPDDRALEDLDRMLRDESPPPRLESRPLPPADPDTPLHLAARAGRTHLEIPTVPTGSNPRSSARSAGFRPVFVKGVNLGVALPGRFPAEFPLERDRYRDWLDKIAAMGANTVRLYTLLPPAFYEALAAHNEASLGDPLWLIHGVWIEEPPGDEFDAPAFREQVHAELARVIDAYHGNLNLPPRPGHASGRYRADVSDHVLALILGREWEPSTVARFDRAHPEERGFRGDYLTLGAGTAMERWLAWLCDAAYAYETERYREQRPVAFTSWPTLDPLRHPTEATHAETNAILAARGEATEEAADMDWNEDGVAVDPMRMRPTRANRAGFFASYHVYPYYPDFMNLDPGYRRARDSEGPSPYIGYLRELVAHHRGVPLVVSELGVPTSRGVAHVHPLGWNHGGHSERGQGEIDARLMRDVHESGAAGGILFAWLDEWFKRNWLVQRFELPAIRNPIWHNLMDAEQNYGILAARAGPAEGGARLDGDASEWDGLAGARVESFRDDARSGVSGRTSRLAGRSGEQAAEAPGGRAAASATHPTGSAGDPMPSMDRVEGESPRPIRSPKDGTSGGRAVAAPREPGGVRPGLSAHSSGNRDAAPGCAGAPALARAGMAADPAYLHLLFEIDGADCDATPGIDWDRLSILAGIDTYGDDAGNHRLAPGDARTLPTGAEFRLRLAGPDASLLEVNPSYDVGTFQPMGPFVSLPRDDGTYRSIVLVPNRRRFGRDGTEFPAVTWDQSPLRYAGTADDAPVDVAASSSGGTGILEVRLPWGLLNFTDPSGHRVLHHTERGLDYGTTTTDRVNLHVSLRDAAGAELDHASVGPWLWRAWDEPEYHLELKESYRILQEAFRSLPDPPAEDER